MNEGAVDGRASGAHGAWPGVRPGQGVRRPEGRGSAAVCRRPCSARARCPRGGARPGARAAGPPGDRPGRERGPGTCTRPGRHVGEAADLAEDRLRRRLRVLRDRTRTRHRWIGISREHEWRHGDLPRPPMPYFPRPPEERRLVRRKSFALEPMARDQAAYEMHLVDHDFYLFTDRATGKDAVVVRGKHDSRGRVHVASPPPILSDAQARERLDVGGALRLLRRPGRSHLARSRRGGADGVQGRDRGGRDERAGGTRPQARVTGPPGGRQRGDTRSRGELIITRQMSGCME